MLVDISADFGVRSCLPAGWLRVRLEDGISVYRLLPVKEKLTPAAVADTPGGHSTATPTSEQVVAAAAAVPSSKYACVKCYGEVKASPEKIFQLLTDETR